MQQQFDFRAIRLVLIIQGTIAITSLLGVMLLLVCLKPQDATIALAILNITSQTTGSIGSLLVLSNIKATPAPTEQNASVIVNAPTGDQADV